MSAQSKAKIIQGYDPKPDPNRCATCGHFLSDRILPDWMVKSNAAGRSVSTMYTVQDYGIEKNMRCGLGGFAVKKTGVCNQWIDPVRA